MGGSGFVSSLFRRGVGLGAKVFFWSVFGGTRISPIFSPP
jgi:hypothetical protein